MGLMIGILVACAVLAIIVGLALKFGKTALKTTTTTTTRIMPATPVPKTSKTTTTATSSSSRGPVVGGGLKVTIGENIKEVRVPEPYYPDGVSVVLPKGYKGIPADKYWTCLPEAYNRAGFTSRPFFEELDIERDLPVLDSLGSHANPFPYPNDLFAGTFWIFGCLKTATKWACFVHGENHALGSAPPTFKSQLVSYSTDLKNWSRPQPIITVPPHDGRDGWYGAGDSCFVYDEATKEFRGYFFEASLGMGCARSTHPEAAPGSWQLYNGPGQPWTSALTSIQYKRLPVNAGNPHVIFSSTRNLWVMVAGEWGQGAITFSTSVDGYEWSNLLRIPFRASPNSTPLYPHIISEEGGTISFVRKARLYWSDTSGSRRMLSCDITIE